MSKTTTTVGSLSFHAVRKEGASLHVADAKKGQFVAGMTVHIAYEGKTWARVVSFTNVGSQVFMSKAANCKLDIGVPLGAECVISLTPISIVPADPRLAKLHRLEELGALTPELEVLKTQILADIAAKEAIAKEEAAQAEASKIKAELEAEVLEIKASLAVA